MKKLSLLLLGPLAIAAVSGWLYLHGGRYVTTDNAYLKSDIYTISSEITGKVIEAVPRDNQAISKGQLLFRIYQQPQRIARERAQATLADVRRRLDSEKIEFATYETAIELARIERDFQASELKRARQLMERGSISNEEYDRLQHAYQRSENALKQKQQDQLVARARLIDPELPTEEYPAYQQAMAELAKAELDFSHTEIYAPVDGIAVNVAALPGENVIMGAALVNVVDTSAHWIEANFKETELTHVRTGQDVEIHIDTYPDEVWHGTVSSITPATGAEFSLLPAQNSSGNWVKVVQRIKVRIDFDDDRLQDQLRAGMSAEVSIDTGHQRQLPWQ